jgi:hypothetical protein
MKGVSTLTLAALLFPNPLPNDIYHFPRGWKYAKNCEGASIEYHYLIDEHLEFPVTPAHHLHFRS